jgi:hypothetical protein
MKKSRAFSISGEVAANAAAARKPATRQWRLRPRLSRRGDDPLRNLWISVQARGRIHIMWRGERALRRNRDVAAMTG